MNNWDYIDIKTGRPAMLIMDLKEDGSKNETCTVCIMSEDGSIIRIKEKVNTVYKRIKKNNSKLMTD